MKRDEFALSKEALAANIEVKITRCIGVKMQLPCLKLQRRVEDFLLRAELGPGVVNCLVKQHFPKVLDHHPWVKVKKDPASTQYHLTVRCDKEVYECMLQVLESYVSPELTVTLTELAEDICEHGWFGERKRRTPKVKVKVKKPLPPPVAVCPPPAIQPPAEVTVTVHGRVVAPQPEPKEVPANRVYFAWRQPVAEEPEMLTVATEEVADPVSETDPLLVAQNIVQLESVEPSPKELLILQINNTIELLETGIVERLAEIQGLKDTQQSLLRVLESFKGDPVVQSGKAA